MSVRYLTPARLDRMSFRIVPLGISLMRTLFNLAIPRHSTPLLFVLGQVQSCYSIQVFHQHSVELLFVAFAAYLLPLLVALAVHKLPFWVELDIASCPFLPAA